MVPIHRVYCDCCGSEVDAIQHKLCPNCQYPVRQEQELLFLETALRDLKRVIRYGGAAISVTDLARRYEGRLQFLYHVRSQGSAPHSTALATQVTIALPPPQTVLQPEGVHPPTAMPPLRVPAPAMLRASTPLRPNASAPFVGQPGIPLAPTASMRGFSFSSDAVVNILAALGGFFILAGALGFVLTTSTSNYLLSFLVIFFLHILFGGAGQLTQRRFPLLRTVSPFYTLIFALLVPVVGYSAYRFVTNSSVAFSPFALLTIAALYATAIYTLLAVTQRFIPFAYLALVALLVGDLALAQALHLMFWWWPSIALLLAFPALLTLPRTSGEAGPLTEAWAILRSPLRMLIYVVVGAACLFLLLFLSMSLLLDLLHAPSEEVRLALFLLASLLCAWTAFWTWRTRRVTWTPLLAYQLVSVSCLSGYVLHFNLTAYVLLLAGTALVYHALVRVAHVQLARYGKLALTLHQLAIGLSALVTLLIAFATPFRLVYHPSIGSTNPNSFYLFLSNSFSSTFIHSGSFTLEQFALGLCCLLTFDIAVMRAGLSRVPTQANWCWLLLLSGLILAVAYGQNVLLWQVSPLWAFLVLSLALLTSAVLTRRLTSPAWANPLDVQALGGIAFTLLLSLGQAPQVVSTLLLGFAALLYSILLFQHRPVHTLLPAGLLVLALPPLFAHLSLVFALALLLPVFAASMERLGLFAKSTSYPYLFTWTLLGPALLYGLVLTSRDLSSSQIVFVNWFGLHLSLAYEIAALGAAWYATALITRTTVWLLPASFFWLVALLFPTNDFWALTILAPLLAIGAGYIERRAQYAWALPFYFAALCGVGMVAYTGLAQGHVAALSWVLLGYALLAFGIGLFTGRLAVFWLIPFCATGAVIVAAALLGDLYRPPVIALGCAVLGLALSRSSLLTLYTRCQRAPLLYALPMYTTALVAALLTGIDGTLGNLNRPFYGALPTALFLYALVAFIVLLVERQPSWNWLVAVFAGWAVLLVQRLTPAYMLGAGVGLVLLGLLSGRLFFLISPVERTPSARHLTKLAWSWPWYIAFIVATYVLARWPYTSSQSVTPDMIVPIMLVFTVLATVVMLIEGTPEFLFFPAIMAAWTIYLWLGISQPVLAIVAYTLLCVVIFITQFAWRYLPATTYWLADTSLHNGLSLGGLCVIVLMALHQGALSANAGALAHAGAFALLMLSLLLFLYGLGHPATVARVLPENMSPAQRAIHLATAHVVRHWCMYAAGALLSLVVPWELLTFHVTQFDVLTLVPASYLLVVAPFLLRDTILPERYIVGQLVALLGAALLLVPTLWLSFNGTDLLPTLLLLAEAFLLLILGLLTRLRIFILSSAALLVVGTLRALFLSIPPSVPLLLIVFGSLLVLLATTLILARHRLQIAWRHWE